MPNALEQIRQDLINRKAFEKWLRENFPDNWQDYKDDTALLRLWLSVKDNSDLLSQFKDSFPTARAEKERIIAETTAKKKTAKEEAEKARLEKGFAGYTGTPQQKGVTITPATPWPEEPKVEPMVLPPPGAYRTAQEAQAAAKAATAATGNLYREVPGNDGYWYIGEGTAPPKEDISETQYTWDEAQQEIAKRGKGFFAASGTSPGKYIIRGQPEEDTSAADAWTKEYQTQSLELQKQRDEAAKAEAERAWRSTTEAGLQNWANQQNQLAYQKWLNEQELAEKKRQFDIQNQPKPIDYKAWKTQLLSELTSPSDWINRWFAERTPTPDVFTNYDETVNRINQLTADVAKGRGAPAGRTPTRPELGKATPWATPEDLAFNLKNAETSLATLRNLLPSMQQKLEGPGQPPMPSWMSQLVAGGQGMTRTPKTGQILNINPASLYGYNPTQTEMVRGLSNYWGDRPWEEIRFESESMLPTGTVGRTAWRPYRQV